MRLNDKFDISRFIDDFDLDKQIATRATKRKLKVKREKIAELQSVDSSYFRGNRHFEDNGKQNYLVFQPVYKYFKKIANIDI